MRLARVATNRRISAEACRLVLVTRQSGGGKDLEDLPMLMGDVDVVQGERRAGDYLFRCGAHVPTPPLSIGISYRSRNAFDLVCCRHSATISKQRVHTA